MIKNYSKLKVILIFGVVVSLIFIFIWDIVALLPEPIRPRVAYFLAKNRAIIFNEYDYSGIGINSSSIYHTKRIASSTNLVDASLFSIDTTGWKTYEYKKGGFTFKYPKDWEVKDVSFDEEEGGNGLVERLEIFPIFSTKDNKDYDGIILHPTQKDGQSNFGYDEYLWGIKYSWIVSQELVINDNKIALISGTVNYPESGFSDRVLLIHKDKIIKFQFRGVDWSDEKRISVFEGDIFNVGAGIISSMRFEK